MKNVKIALATILQTGVFLLIGAIAIFNFVQSCNDDESELTEIKEMFEKNKAEIAEINKQIASMVDYARTANKYYDSLYKANSKTIKRFNYEISQMDELFKNSSDTMLVNSVIRFWSDRFYTKLPGFFQTAVNDTGITTGSENISTGRELLPPE